MLKEIFETIGLVNSILGVISLAIVLLAVFVGINWFVYFIAQSWEKGKKAAFSK